METQVPSGVPVTHCRMWSHAELAALMALLMPRACTCARSEAAGTSVQKCPSKSHGISKHTTQTLLVGLASSKQTRPKECDQHRSKQWTKRRSLHNILHHASLACLYIARTRCMCILTGLCKKSPVFDKTPALMHAPECCHEALRQHQE